MHTLTLVLVSVPTSDLRQSCNALLEPHRLDWDAVDRPSRLDYWTIGRGAIADEETAAALKIEGDEDLARNVCFVSRLPRDFVPGAVVAPDGTWYDLGDHGWRFVDHETRANAAARARWEVQVKQVLATHSDCVAVEFNTHS